jgi:hypothetical protein
VSASLKGKREADGVRIAPRKLPSPFKEAARSRGVSSHERALTCIPKTVARTDAKRFQAPVCRAEVSKETVSLFEVVGRNLLVGTGARPEPIGEALVQARPCFFRDRRVGGVADEDVPEAESVLAGHARARRLNEPLTHEPLEKSADHGLGRGKMEERAEPEFFADDSGRPKNPPLVMTETIKTGGQKRLERLRNRDVATIFLCGKGKQLLEEERVSLRHGDGACLHPWVEGHRESFRQGIGITLRERLELDVLSRPARPVV